MDIAPELEQRLRQFFRKGNHFMLLLWRLGLGGYVNSMPDVMGRIMVLTHVGRKTGAQRRTPVNYVEIHGDIYCTAGFGKISDWYRNILKEPRVEIWLPEGWWEGVAEDVSHHPDRNSIMRQVLIASGFVAHSMGMNPKEMSDEQIAQSTTNYRLIRIRRTSACTGRGGPGDLAWIWPGLTLVLLPMVLFRRRK
jgi:deazaflavin-dependent oxidoreductase (nitroreductase family)